MLTPIFTADLVKRAERRRAGRHRGAARRRPAGPFKIDLAQRLGDQLSTERGKVPAVGPAFDQLPSDPTERAGALRLKYTLQDQLDRAATHAFSDSFLIAAAFGLAALLPIGLGRRRRVSL